MGILILFGFLSIGRLEAEFLFDMAVLVIVHNMIDRCHASRIEIQDRAIKIYSFFIWPRNGNIK